MGTPDAPRLTRGYLVFGLVFAAAGVGLWAALSGSLYGRAEIIVTAAQTRASGEYLVTVQDGGGASAVPDPQVVPGRIHEQTFDGSQAFAASGKVPRASDTIGDVTLRNTTPRSQTLVATTRVLAPDGTLLRLKDRVVVPANGTVIAAVYPDKPESFRQLAPTRLTIPGLPVSQQALIYGETTAALPAGGGEVPAVTVEDLKNAEAALVKSLSREALEKFDGMLAEREKLYSKMVHKEIVSSTADAKAGDQRTEFTAAVTLKVVALAFDEVRLSGQVRQHLSEQLPFTHELVALDPSSLKYETQRYDPVRKEVTLKVYAEGQSALKPGSPLLNPATMTGLTKTQIQTFFARYPEVKSVEVRFSPEGLPRAPRSASRIIFTVR
ncbi:MAG: hypothetical protein Q7S23_06050 [bacterium]|nr:hypothetical protein [bacterium]